MRSGKRSTESAVRRQSGAGATVPHRERARAACQVVQGYAHQSLLVQDGTGVLERRLTRVVERNAPASAVEQGAAELALKPRE